MRIPLRFEIWDNWENANQRDKSQNIFVSEINGLKGLIAIHFDNDTKKFLDTIGLSRGNLRATRKSLFKAVNNALRHGKKSGMFEMFLPVEGGLYILAD